MSKTTEGYHGVLYSSKRGMKSIRRETFEAASDLGYPIEVLRKIMNAETPAEMNNIMIDARRKYL